MLVVDNFICIADPERKKDNLVTALMINKTSANDENPFFVRATFWDRQADLVEKYFKKGKTVLLTGQLTFREYNQKTYFDINVSHFNFVDLGGKREDSPQPQQESNNLEAVGAASATSEEDIPF